MKKQVQQGPKQLPGESGVKAKVKADIRKAEEEEEGVCLTVAFHHKCPHWKLRRWSDKEEESTDMEYTKEAEEHNAREGSPEPVRGERKPRAERSGTQEPQEGRTRLAGMEEAQKTPREKPRSWYSPKNKNERNTEAIIRVWKVVD